MYLNRNEAKFIMMACRVAACVYDFDNNDSNEEFKKRYGITIEEAEALLKNLEDKTIRFLNE